MVDYRIIDADGLVMEPDSELRDFSQVFRIC